MPRKKIPQAVDYTALSNYDRNKPKVEDLFNQQLKLLNEQLRRLKEHMFLEKNMAFDRDIAKQAQELSKAVTSVGQMFFKIQDMARHAAEGMNTEEQMEVVCDMVRSWGRNNRYKFWRIMHELEYELKNEDRLAEAEAGEPEQPPVPGIED